MEVDGQGGIFRERLGSGMRGGGTGQPRGRLGGGVWGSKGGGPKGKAWA